MAYDTLYGIALESVGAGSALCTLGVKLAHEVQKIGGWDETASTYTCASQQRELVENVVSHSQHNKTINRDEYARLEEFVEEVGMVENGVVGYF